MGPPIGTWGPWAPGDYGPLSLWTERRGRAGGAIGFPLFGRECGLRCKSSDFKTQQNRIWMTKGSPLDPSCDFMPYFQSHSSDGDPLHATIICRRMVGNMSSKVHVKRVRILFFIGKRSSSYRRWTTKRATSSNRFWHSRTTTKPDGLTHVIHPIAWTIKSDDNFI